MNFVLILLRVFALSVIRKLSRQLIQAYGEWSVQGIRPHLFHFPHTNKLFLSAVKTADFLIILTVQRKTTIINIPPGGILKR